MKLTNKEYENLSQQCSPNTKYCKTLPMSFIIGGLICCLGQALNNIYTIAGLDETQAGTLTSVTLVFISAILTGFGIYGRNEGYVPPANDRGSR